MRVKTPLFPFWMETDAYGSYTTGSLTPFPVELSAEDFGTLFWGVRSWTLGGSFTYKIPDVPGVSYGPDVVEAFSVELTEWLLGGTESEQNRVENSGYRFEGDHSGTQPFTANLFWGRQLEGSPLYPRSLWSGNHGGPSGNVKPGLMLRIVFNSGSDFYLRELRTDMPVSLRLGETATTISGVTLQAQTFDWHTGYNAVPDAGACSMGDFTAELTPASYFEFRKSDGTGPVWNIATGAQLINPRTT